MRSYWHSSKRCPTQIALKFLVLLAGQPATVGTAAAALNRAHRRCPIILPGSSETGLVSARAEGYYSIYSLGIPRYWKSMSRRLLKRENIAKLAEDADIDAFDRKVLREFLTPEGRIRAFPAQEKKLLVIIRYALEAFEMDRRYTEKEINEIIKQRFNENSASIRRHFIEYKMMQREAGVYWRI